MHTSNAKTGRSFQRFECINEMKETEIGLLKHKQQSGEYLKHNIQTVSKIIKTKLCSVSEDAVAGDKYYVDIKNVSSKKSARMKLDDDKFKQNSEFLESNEDNKENEGASCVCECHCRRNFQRHGLTKKSKLKSTQYNRSYSDDKLLHHTQRNTTLGVIKVKESEQTSTLFKTRLKSENSSERLSVGFGESHKRYINLVCLRVRSSMAKILCHCVILLLLCLCGVVMVHQNIGKTDNKLIHSEHTEGYKYKQDNVITTPESSIIRDLPFRSVSKDDFEKHLANSKSAAEMLKIFFSDPDLTEEQVNSIMYMKKHQKYYGSKSMGTNRMMREEEYDRNYREIAYQHYLEFERSPYADCSVPKPEIVRIEDTYSDSVRHYLPSCTVVNRCSNSTACCPRGYVCGPKRDNGIELIDKFFMVLERVPGTDDLRPAKDLVAAKTIINHTACECQKVDVTTNCRKECPLQFTKRRPGADCECICASGHRKCHKIHKGLLPLDEKDLECIKEDRCIVPKCQAGTFSISTGFCPHFRRHRG
ncbi:uncharacterized protein LOC123557435 isoform X2 [Mercenaria mercenaria]|uniref:uncharacterized protein LOC123557435 isoform X2 n=1 Tax=Mercenaria mercenaria TaxID=6596 RepID=UPI001E1D2F60|nr:uncharacterized protein LOC123557435 isoform X2 [Mercenaria mercenaria]